jgi:hypothetical protein
VAGVHARGVDVVIANDARRGIAAVVEAIGLVALLPFGALIAALLIWASRTAIVRLLGAE